MRIHDLEAAEWREAAGGYHRKSIAGDVALMDIGNAAELQMEGDGEHLILVLNGSGKVAAGSRGAFLSGGICLGLAPGERVTLRPDAEKGLLLLYVRLAEDAAGSLFASIPERSDTWEIASRPAGPVAVSNPAELEPARAEDQWEDDDDEEDEGAEADAAGSEAVVTEAEAIAPTHQAEEAARAESAERSGEVDDDDDEDEDEDLVADEARDEDGAGAAVAEPVMMEPAERGAFAGEEATLAAAANAPGAEETP
ncbi:MAG TPA: hypothetical protein VFK80_06310, partial [Limnochordia bacterium]|nr:hypothetical protein [Limnochordia bacterium]